jgi:phosphatidylglycerophosphate synthase
MSLDVIISITAFTAVGAGIVLYLIKLKTQGHESYARVDSQGSSKLVSKSVMEMGYWWFQVPGEMLVKRNVSPDQVSWASLVVGFLAGCLMAFGFFGVAATLLFTSAILDALDGYVARRTEKFSPCGEILDSSLDRYVDFFFFAGLIIFYRDSIAVMLITLFAMLGSFMISYSSAKAQAMNIKPPRGSMKRSDRLVYLIAGGYFASLSINFFENSTNTFPSGIPMVLVLLMIAVLSNISAVQRLKTLAVNANNREKENTNNQNTSDKNT